jgi:4a-hydroxytetrahydrobiopterin dehydratase
MPKLTQPDIDAALQTLSGWSQKGDAIHKQYSFRDFAAAMEFVNRVAEAAEAADHHPDIDIRYNKVALALSTHSTGGLTEKDVALAREIEAVNR